MLRPCNPGVALGITALELLMTLAIMSVLSLLAAPGLREYAMDRRMDAALAAMHTDFTRARRAAVDRNAYVIACPGTRLRACAGPPAWEQGWLLFEDRNGDLDWQDGEPLLRSGSPLEMLTVRSAPSRNRIRFSPAGTAPASNASVVFCDRRGWTHGRKLVISNTGRLRRDTLVEGDNVRCVH